MSARPRLLVVDDERSIAPIVERFATRLGFDVAYRPDGREALNALRDLRPDVALVDLQMPALDGLEVLRAVKAADPRCHVIVMTGHATVDTAIEAVRSGALDYLSKPFDFHRLERLLSTVHRAPQGRALCAPPAVERFEFHGMVGRSERMRDLCASIRRLAPHLRTVLITGETGTGKELVARALHREGPRRDKRFVTLNCSAMVETLFESELFGHVRGAFTGAAESKTGLFEHANGGTLFLDEAGELPLALQPKLLRAVELGEVHRVGSLESKRADVCVIAATNRDLVAEVDAGRFRSDLFYRLNILEIHLPPLRERPEDIACLAAEFARLCADRMRQTVTGLTSEAERLLERAPWPGNVRELRNVIERACLFSGGGIIGVDDVRAAMDGGVSRGASAPGRVPAVQASDRQLSTAQRDHIRRVLRDTHGNKRAAARELGISRRTLYRWLDRLEIDQ